MLPACTVQGVGGTGDSCNDCSFEPLQGQPVPVASCQRDGLSLTCAWAEEGPLLAPPLSDLQHSMSLHLGDGSRVPSVSNEGGIITYDLGVTTWEAGDGIRFDTTLRAATDGEMLELGTTRQPFTAAELSAGVDVYSEYEIWDIGLVAELSMISELGFTGATSLEPATYELKRTAQVLRFVVHPDDGMKIENTDGTIAAMVEQPGYYVFVNEKVAAYDDNPQTVD
ncbi:MAG: hypothetical protein KJO07_05610 [Deltaproteobacteria bacterium]|jgi:hypothetical protein|nr:hypothetical protein [Deltaproteobacteria bacterium]